MGIVDTFQVNNFRFVRPSENDGLGWSVGDTLDILTVDYQEKKVTANTGFVLKGSATHKPWPADVVPVPPPSNDNTDAGSVALSVATFALSALGVAALI